MGTFCSHFHVYADFRTSFTVYYIDIYKKET